MSLYDYTHATVETVRSEADAGIEAADALIAEAVTAPPSLEETLRPLELARAAVAVAYGRGAFLAEVHTDAELRDAATDANERIEKWRVGLSFRPDIYRAVTAFSTTDEARALTGEQKRLLEHWQRDLRRAGQELSNEERDELERLKGRLVEVQVAFGRNLNDFRDGIDVTRERLDGLPDAYVERLSAGTSSGTYRVSLDYPELFPLLQHARDRELRRVMFEKHWTAAVAENRGLLLEALELRARIAALLGEPSWAHHAMELKMARTPERVERLYGDLLPPLGSRIGAELDAMAARMALDGHDGPIQPWDWRYYDTLRRREEHGIDQELVAEHFPLDQTLDGLFELTGEVIGIEVQAVMPTRAWHESVRLYEIIDRAAGTHIAHFYADLFPREGKFTHAAAFPLVIGHRAADGSHVAPVSAIVANFTPPSAERPALLQHGEVTTLFHEFGHILHMSLSRAEFTRFSGGETEWDFVEAPSQIMEHWAWDPDVLARFARHYLTGELLPIELREGLAASRFVNGAGRTAMQAFYGQVDLAVHAGDVPDVEDALRRAFAVTRMPYPEGTYLLAGFGHILGGYDAGYYGYLWAEVIGDDMYGRFAREGVLSPRVGADYRREILEPNGARAADDLVRSFLGREPSPAEFLRLRGMD